MMIISLTGTPGTGKTSIAEHFEDFRVINLTKFLKKNNLGEEGEKEFEADIEAMKQELEEEIRGGEDLIIEGHLSHHFPADYCVVLRCDPEELEHRLEKRDYSDQKIRENLESEALDLILSEAVNEQERIIEIDTTDSDSIKVAERIKKRIENDETGYGEIDFSDWL